MFEKEDFEKYMKDSEDYYDNREPMTERKLYQLWKDGAEFGYNKANKELQKAKQIIQEFLELNYSEFTKTNAVFLHADKFLKETK